MSRFENTIALVTGGNSGLGAAAARYLADEGATVVITARRADELEKVRVELGPDALAVPADITSAEDRARLFDVVRERFGRIDVVVANAGAGSYAMLGDYTPEIVESTFSVNLTSVVFTVQGALPLIPDGGSIVVMSSIEGLRGSPGLALYAATKAATQSLTRTWANELAGRRIRVNSISPGVVYTPAYERNGIAPEDLADVVTTIPAGRTGETSEIGRAIGFLASSDASFVNGANLVADGGQTAVV